MERAALGTAVGLYAASTALAVGAVIGWAQAPAHLVLSLALVAMGVGLSTRLFAGATRRRGAASLALAGAVVLLSLGWTPLVRLGHALLAGRELVSPSPWGLLLALLLPVGVPFLVLGLSAALVADPSLDARRGFLGALPAGAAAGLLVAGGIGDSVHGRIASTSIAGAILLVLALVRLRRHGGAPASSQPRETARAWTSRLALLVLGAGLAVSLRGLWRGWEILGGAGDWSRYAGAVVLTGAVAAASLSSSGARGGRPTRRAGGSGRAVFGAAALALLCPLLPAWPVLRGIFQEAVPGEGVHHPGFPLLLLALVTLGLCGVAAAASAGEALSSAAGRLYPADAVGLLFLGAGAGWAVATFLLLPAVGFPRTAAAGAFLAVLVALTPSGAPAAARRRAPALAAAAVGVIATLFVVIWPPGTIEFHAVESGRGDRVLVLRDGATPPLAAIARRDGDVVLSYGGTVLSRSGVGGLADRVMAGHLPFMLGAAPGRALVLTAGPEDPVRGLLSHDEQVDLRVPSSAARDLPALLPDPAPPGATAAAGAPAPPLPEARAIAGTLIPSSSNLLVVLLPRPRHPLAAPYFRSAFYRRAAEALGEKGILVQLMDLSTVPADDIAPLLRASGDAFPHRQLWSFDLGADGAYLLAASRSPLVPSYKSMTPSQSGEGAAGEQLRRDLLRSGLSENDDMVLGFVAAWDDPSLPRGIGGDGEPSSGVDAVRRVVYADQQRVLPVRDVTVYQEGGLYLLPLDLQTRIAGWKEKDSSLEFVTQLARLPETGGSGVYREVRPSVTIAGRAVELSARATPMLLPDPEDIVKPLTDAGQEDVVRTGRSVLHGHPAFWHLKQEPAAPRDQTLLFVWYCPVQGRRFYLRYRTVEGTPDSPDPLVSWVVHNVSCRHPG